MSNSVVSAFRRNIIIVLPLLLTLTTARAEIIERIMAIVGGQPVLLSDVNAALQFRQVEPPAGTADPLAYALDRLIERALILTEVDRFQPPEPAPIEISLRVEELEQRAGSAAVFTKALAVTGMTRDRLRRHIRDDLRIETYLNQRFGTNGAISSWIAELRRRAEITVLYGR
jgi:hypothetical protein